MKTVEIDEKELGSNGKLAGDEKPAMSARAGRPSMKSISECRKNWTRQWKSCANKALYDALGRGS